MSSQSPLHEAIPEPHLSDIDVDLSQDINEVCLEVFDELKNSKDTANDEDNTLLVNLHSKVCQKLRIARSKSVVIYGSPGSLPDHAARPCCQIV